MSFEKLLTPDEAAEFLTVSENVLRSLRSARSGPPYYKISGAIRYDVRDLREWLAAQRRLGPVDAAQS